MQSYKILINHPWEGFQAKEPARQPLPPSWRNYWLIYRDPETYNDSEQLLVRHFARHRTESMCRKREVTLWGERRCSPSE